MKVLMALFLRRLRPLFCRSKADPKRVLLFATTAIGDSVMISSCVRYIGESGCHICLVGSQHAIKILGNHRVVRDRILYRRGWVRALALIPKLWSLNCSVGLVLHVSDSAAWLLASIGATEEGFAGEWLSYQKPPFPIRWVDDSVAAHIAEKHCLIAAHALGIDSNYTLRNEIFGRSRPAGGGTGRGRRQRTIGLVPGAQNFYKCWPVNKFIELGATLSDHGYQIVIFGTEHEAHLIKALSAGVPSATVFSGDLDAVFDRLDTLCCLVTNDTGLMHVADALGCPVVALFAATPAFLAAPLDAERSTTIHKPVTCYPSTKFKITPTTCYNKQCDNPMCMDQISVADVFSRVIGLDSRIRQSEKNFSECQVQLWQ